MAIESEIKLLRIETKTAKAVPTSVSEDASFVLVLGNFDGVHSAHQKLFEEAFALREQLASESMLPVEVAAWYFSPPSLDYLPARKEGHITTVEEKRSLLAALGVRYLFEADFPALCHLTPGDFCNRILKQICRGVGFVCGFNFRFGKDAAGNADLLTHLAAPCPVHILSAVRDISGLPISASRIRTILKEGKPEEAAALMGHPYTVSGTVLHGKALGRTLGFPTVNLSFPAEKLIPLSGVYFSKVTTPKGIYGGITNIGIRPTTDSERNDFAQEVNCETHIINYAGNLYGQFITVSLLHYCRGEQTFPSLAALQEAIGDDLKTANRYFSLHTP